MSINLYTHRGLFYLTIPNTLRDVPVGAGFLWDDTLNAWYTPHLIVALRLRRYANKQTKKLLDNLYANARPWSKALLHSPDRKPYSFQVRSAKHILSRAMAQKHTYLADDPGLGKSFTLSMVLDTAPGFSLMIAPPFLKYNWESELNMNLSIKKKIEIISTTKDIDFDADILICPDSLIDNKDVRMELKRRHYRWLMVDEAHRFKTLEAKRTIYLLGGQLPLLQNRSLINIADHIVFASGTPMPNGRAMEMYPAIRTLDHECIGNKNLHQYGYRYCAPTVKRGHVSFNGSANLDVLKDLTSDLFIRHRKQDVLKELPPKRERIILLGEDMKPELRRFAKEVLGPHVNISEMIKNIKADPRGQIATLVKKVGLQKVDLATEYIMSKMEGDDDPFIIFAWHTEVLHRLKENFRKYRPFYIDGKTPMSDRYKQVKEFQNSKTLRPFIGNTKAMGVGLTLTKAKRVYVVEPSWEPTADSQASDRAHRIGQKDRLEVDYLVLRDSFDEYRVRSQLKKQDNINRIF